MRLGVLVLHRWFGLFMAVFLTIAGLTGAVISFNHELDEWLNPTLFKIENHGGAAGRGKPLSPLLLAARVEAADPRVRVNWLPLEVEPGHSFSPWVSPRVDPVTGKPFELDFDQLFVDPADGRLIGQRQWGACCLERENLIAFLYKLHYTLHIPANWGVWMMGIVGIVWIFDCFIGAWLTFPRGRPFFSKWKTSWKVKRERLNFDLHRAGGLWLWVLLLIMAVSSVSLNLHDEVFEPAVKLFSRVTPTAFDLREERPPERPIEARQSRETILACALEEAKRRGWSDAPTGIFYSAGFGLYGVGFGKEHAPGLGNPWLYFDGATGKYAGDLLPGEGTAGDFFLQIQFPLHSGQIAGLTGRTVICITGLAVAMLSITGIVVWFRKRAVGKVIRSRAANPAAASDPL